MIHKATSSSRGELLFQRATNIHMNWIPWAYWDKVKVVLPFNLFFCVSGRSLWDTSLQLPRTIFIAMKKGVLWGPASLRQLHGICFMSGSPSWSHIELRSMCVCLPAEMGTSERYKAKHYLGRTMFSAWVPRKHSWLHRGWCWKAVLKIIIRKAITSPLQKMSYNI